MSIDHILIRLNEGGVRKATIEDMRAAGWLPLASLSPTCLDVYREDYKRAKEGFTFTGTAVADIFDRLLTAEYEVGLRGMDLSRCDEEVQTERDTAAERRIERDDARAEVERLTARVQQLGEEGRRALRERDEARDERDKLRAALRGVASALGNLGATVEAAGLLALVEPGNPDT